MKKIFLFLVLALAFAGAALADTATVTETITATVTQTITPTPTITPFANVNQAGVKTGKIVDVTELKQQILVDTAGGNILALLSQDDGNTAASRSLAIWDGDGNTVYSRSWTVGQAIPMRIYEPVTMEGSAPVVFVGLPYNKSLTVKTTFKIKIIKQ